MVGEINVYRIARPTVTELRKVAPRFNVTDAQIDRLLASNYGGLWGYHRLIDAIDDAARM